MIKYDFAFGDTRGIREIMINHAKGLSLPAPWQDFGYPDHEGNPKLIELTRKLIKDLTGHDYKYVIITNGATHAIHAAIHATRTLSTDKVITNELYFGFYPGIVETNGLQHVTRSQIKTPSADDIVLLDSPSNPLGEILDYNSVAGEKLIWDAAYWSPTYTKDFNSHLRPPKVNDVMVGSFNKLTGINGLRVGWMATDDSIYNIKASDYVTNTLCGVTASGQWAVEKILTTVDLDRFYHVSAAMLDDNKTELQKLSGIFSNQHIPKIGMFALWESDQKIDSLLEKAGVKFYPGFSVGYKERSWRINLANTPSQTRDMVKDVLKLDKVRKK